MLKIFKTILFANLFFTYIAVTKPLSVISKLWNFISHLGVQQHLEEENALTVLFNRIAFLSSISLVFFAVSLFIDEVYFFAWYTLFVTSVYFLVLLFNGLQKIYWARFSATFGTVLWVSFYHICFTGFFSQSLAVGAAIIVNYVAFRKKESLVKPMFFLHAGVYIGALLFGIYGEPLIEYNDYAPLGLISFLISMGWVSIVLITFHNEMKKLILKLELKNEELEKTTNDLERFSYIASHDLKSPLRTIISFSGLIKRDLRKENFHEIEEKIGFVRSGAEKMNLLIDGILELSHLKTIRLSDRKEIDLNEVFESAMLNLSEDLTDLNAKVVADNLPLYVGSQVEFILLFQNLIQNGVKYNKSEVPEVQITCEKKSDHLFITFKDNGIGIKEEFFDEIFQFFKRLHTSEEYEGTGIGLGLCKRIVRNYLGEVRVMSTVGKGSEFTLVLPEVNLEPENLPERNSFL